jgi:iron complex outermembrane receptor protein
MRLQVIRRSRPSLPIVIKQIVVAIGIIVFAAPAYVTAQSGAAIEEIIVTARKRDENVQDIPESITVFNATTIERAGITNIQDFAALTPNLVIIDQLRPGYQTITLRGMTTVQGGQAPFAMIVDGVQQASMDFLNQELFDIESIEVLRGPQGTLYGGGAVGGAINIVTKKPGDNFRVSGKVSASEGSTYTGAISVSGPVSETTGFRAFAIYTDSDGLIPNRSAPVNNDFREEFVIGGSLYFQPSDQLSIELNAKYTDGDTGAIYLAPVDDANFDNFDASVDPNTDVIGIDMRKLQNYSAKIDYDLGNMTLTAITGYHDAQQDLFADGDFSPTPFFAQTWTLNSEAINQEIRLASANDQSMRWIIGAFYQDREILDVSRFGFLTPDNTVDPFPGGSTDEKNSKSWAFFGELSYDVTETLEFTAGLRYDSDKQDSVDLLSSGSEVSETFDELQPKLSIAYGISETAKAYATYARGFRSGGFNQRVSLVNRKFENEVSDSFEIGIKSELADGSVILNAAVFHIDYDNQQFFFSGVTDTGVFRNVINIDKTSIDGFEIELIARPIDQLTLQGSIGYVDTEIDDFDGSGFFIGNRTPQVNDLTAALSAELYQPITDSLNLLARVDYSNRGDVFWDIANRVSSPSKDFINLRVGVDNEKWGFFVVGNNITDERAPTAVGTDVFGPGQHLRTPNRPKSWGAEFRFNF